MEFDRTLPGGAAVAKVAGLGVAALLATTIAAAPGRAWADPAEDPAQAPAAAEDSGGEVVPEARQEGSAPATVAVEAPAQEPTVLEAPAKVAQAASGESVSSAEGTSQGTVSVTVRDAAKEAAPHGAVAGETPSAADADGQRYGTGAGGSAELPASQVTPDLTADAPGESAASAEGATGTVARATTAPKATAQSTAAATSKPQESATAERQTRRTASVAATPKDIAANATISATAAAKAPAPKADENVYRMYNPNSGEHFYTASLNEATHLFGVGWRWEAVAYKAASRGGSAVYRLYNPNAGNHFYTLSKAESDHLRKVGWRYEDVAWYSVGSTALYRLYNPNSAIGEHLYTTSKAERDSVARAGWRYEGTAWSVTPGAFDIKARWVVSPAYGSQERYWIQKDATLARGRYILPSEGTGYSVAAYARPSGAVVRGAWYDGGNHVYLADNDGRLANQSAGWLKTSTYSGNGMQRYYMDGLGRAKAGEFKVDGKSYLGRTDTGYVVRGTYFLGDTRYVANNDGVIQSKKSRKQIYVDWAKSIAADNRHGYSQINRWGPNYDCSALVISALRQAGYQTGAANSTRDMRRELTRYGWQVVSPNPSNLQYGDILLHDGVHTAIWCGNGQLVEAWEDENGSWEGYRSGDQTGQEIRVRSYYNDGWLCFLRHA